MCVCVCVCVCVSRLLGILIPVSTLLISPRTIFTHSLPPLCFHQCLPDQCQGLSRAFQGPPNPHSLPPEGECVVSVVSHLSATCQPPVMACQPPVSHLSTTSQSPVSHLSVTCHHLSTTSQPPVSHLSTTSQPPVNHLSTTCRPHGILTPLRMPHSSARRSSCKATPRADTALTLTPSACCTHVCGRARVCVCVCAGTRVRVCNYAL